MQFFTVDLELANGKVVLSSPYAKENWEDPPSGCLGEAEPANLSSVSADR